MTTPPPLPGPLAHLAPLLDDYGYLAVGLLVLLDNCGIPVPGQTVLVLAAVYAGTGRMSIAGVVAVAFTAAVVGNSLGYLIGRTGGHAFVHRWGKYVWLTPARMAHAEGFFRRNGVKVVVVARFIDVLRQTNGIIAGTTDMAWRRFLPANIVGAALWVGVWSALGYALGTDIGTLYEQALRYQVYLLAGLGVLVALVGLRAYLKRRRRTASGAAAEAEPGADAGAEGVTDGGEAAAEGAEGADGPAPDGPAEDGPAGTGRGEGPAGPEGGTAEGSTGPRPDPPPPGAGGGGSGGRGPGRGHGPDGPDDQPSRMTSNGEA
ncbi:DedA family protein [Streptomyces sp. NRRL B-24484]|uniref:DedA family protein n=1 Tax=Streptomyces sp. NRRL B-24484 TaxID=1463833 RepID=UPI0007C4BCE1|nr:VTT domain-containing protein [Streptomyces sp. NRRL B-24484]